MGSGGARDVFLVAGRWLCHLPSVDDELEMDQESVSLAAKQEAFHTGAT
jgi:hypothetical protein